MTVSEDWGGTAETADEAPYPSEEGVNTPVARDHARDTRVREDNTSASGEPDMPDCGTADPAADPTAVADGNRSGGFRTRILAHIHLPDIWDDRPGVTKLTAYARHGAGAPPGGPLRTIQIWWFRLVCLPITVSAYWKAWALERPLRGTPVLIVQIVWWLLNIATLIRFL